MNSKKIVHFLILLCATVMLLGGCGGGGGGRSSKAVLPKIYYIGEFHGELAPYLREIAAEFLPYDGEATDAPLIVSLRNDFAPDKSTKEALIKVSDAGRFVAIEHATIDEVNVFLKVIGMEPNFSMDVVSNDLRYVELYAVKKVFRDAFTSDIITWVTPAAAAAPRQLSEPIASDDGKPEVPNQEAFNEMRASNVAKYAADNEAQLKAIKNVNEAGRAEVSARAAVSASTNDLTQLAQAQIHTVDASYSQQNFKITYSIYACHSYNEADKTDYDWFIVQQRGKLNPVNSYRNTDAHDGYVSEILGYMINYDFDNQLDYDNSTSYAKLMESTPSSANGSSTTTSGINWSLGGNVGLTPAGPSGGLSAGVSFSSSESVTISDSTVENKSASYERPTKAHWTYSFPRPTLKSSARPFSMGKFNDAVTLSRSYFQPYNQWIWMIHPDGREKIKQFKSKFTWKNGISHGDAHSVWFSYKKLKHEDWRSNSSTYDIPFIYPPLIVGKNLDFNKAPQTRSLEFGTARNWIAVSGEPSWCTLSKVPEAMEPKDTVSGDINATGSIKVTVNENTTGIDRTATIKLSTADGKGTYDVKVFQSKN